MGEQSDWRPPKEDRQGLAMFIAGTCIVLGLVCRGCAMGWASESVRRFAGSVGDARSDMLWYSFVGDVGAVLALFGTILLAILIGQWTRAGRSGSQH
ncbi:MAG TPA: hypothetical protein VGN72_06925 [Tepidisphaeraceae bacterium]|nr:hypothetical protein [Tepidisphaeraceae bacterium]